MSEQDEYTPSVDEVRHGLIAGQIALARGAVDDPDTVAIQSECGKQFDRMIERVRREAAADALEQAAAAYRDGQITGIFYGRNDYTKAWLNARAAAIREAGDLNG